MQPRAVKNLFYLLFAESESVIKFMNVGMMTP